MTSVSKMLHAEGLTPSPDPCVQGDPSAVPYAVQQVQELLVGITSVSTVLHADVLTPVCRVIHQRCHMQCSSCRGCGVSITSVNYNAACNRKYPLSLMIINV